VLFSHVLFILYNLVLIVLYLSFNLMAKKIIGIFCGSYVIQIISFFVQELWLYD